MRWDVVCADVLDWASQYEGPKFHAVLCDPPYEIGFMNKAFDKTGVAFQPDTWAAIAEHLHPGGFVMAFGGSRTVHRLMTAMEDSGLVMHPLIGWANGAGFPKATRVDAQHAKRRGVVKCWKGKAISNDAMVSLPYRERLVWHWHEQATKGHRYGLQALKPALEFVCVAQKSYAGKPVECITETGAGALWVDGGRIGTSEECGRPQGTMPQPMDWGNKSNDRDGDAFRTVGHPSGRWPANFALCHSFLPVMRLCGSIHPEAELAIRGYYNGYTAVSILRQGRRATTVAVEPWTEVLQPRMRQQRQEGETTARTEWASDADLPAMRQGISVLPSVGQEGQAEVLQLGLQDSVPKDADGREERKVRGISHRRSESEDAGATTDNTGREQPALDGGQISRGAWLHSCPRRQLEARDKGPDRDNGDEERIYLGASPGDGIEAGASIGQGRESASYQRRHDGQQAREPGGPGQSNTFAEAQGDGSQDRGAGAGSGTLTVLARDVPEEWLDYFEYTGENLGCERAGTRRVKPGVWGAKQNTQCGSGGTMGDGWAQRPTVDPGVADPDGLETIPAWHCAPGCPTLLLDESARFFFQADWQHEVAEAIEGAAPFRYQAKAGRKERDAGLEGMAEQIVHKFGHGNNETDSFTAAHQPVYRNPHPTVKPIALCRWLATLLLPPAEYGPRRIAIPFGGSGSEGIGAGLAGWEEIVLIEMEREYCDIAEARLTHWLAEPQQMELIQAE